MNLDKLFAFLSEQWARHSPTIAVHLALLLALQLAVLQPGLFQGETLWAWFKSVMDAGLLELGIKPERAYVLGLLAYVYLAGIQLAASQLAALPLLRPSYAEPPLHEAQLRTAARLLPGPPDFFAISRRLRELQQRYEHAARARGEGEPLPWLGRRRRELQRYLGLCMLCALGCALWLIAGAPGALSHERALGLLLAWLMAALLLRWSLRRYYERYIHELRWAALNELEQARADDPWQLDPLAEARSRVLARHTAFEQAWSRSPAGLARRLSSRLPLRLGQALRQRLAWAELPGTEEDWALLSSLASRQDAAAPPPAAALDCSPYLGRFAALLECPGAGLAMLVDPALGLAPAAPGHGASFCLASRRHGGSVMSLGYEPGAAVARLRCWSARWACLLPLGVVPIEQLAQGRLPSEQAWRLASRALDSAGWTREAMQLDAQRLEAVQDLQPGASYLLRAKLRSGIEALAVLQCFATPRPGHCLLAWRLLEAFEDRRDVALAAPWWRLRGWQTLLARDPRAP